MFLFGVHKTSIVFQFVCYPECKNVYKGHCYVKQRSMKWYDAEKNCISRGGHLVDIADKEEEDFVRSKFLSL